jgi:hypothetical protein
MDDKIICVKDDRIRFSEELDVKLFLNIVSELLDVEEIDMDIPGSLCIDVPDEEAELNDPEMYERREEVLWVYKNHSEGWEEENRKNAGSIISCSDKFEFI